MARIENHYNTLMLIVDATEVSENTVTISRELYAEFMAIIQEAKNIIIPVLCVSTLIPSPAYTGAYMLTSFTPPRNLVFSKGSATITVSGGGLG